MPLKRKVFKIISPIITGSLSFSVSIAEQMRANTHLTEICWWHTQKPASDWIARETVLVCDFSWAACRLPEVAIVALLLRAAYFHRHSPGDDEHKTKNRKKRVGNFPPSFVAYLNAKSPENFCKTFCPVSATTNNQLTHKTSSSQ